jgi:hypothetical protein
MMQQWGIISLPKGRLARKCESQRKPRLKEEVDHDIGGTVEESSASRIWKKQEDAPRLHFLLCDKQYEQMYDFHR